MFFSSKISNSILSYCDREGIDREALYNHSDWPEEFLKDPSCWLESHKLESLLDHVEKDVGDVEKIAHMSPKLHAWGPLDSVLKLMGRPHDILTQPDRFLSYFISPPPPVDFIEKDEESVSFRIPISSEEYPLVTRFLKGAFESLPLYVGRSAAQVLWNENLVTISWTEKQESFLNEREDSNLNPKLVTNLMHAIEKSQKEIEAKNKELQSRLSEIENLKLQIAAVQNSLGAKTEVDPALFEASLSKLSDSVARFHDYLVRSQQLITVLVGSERTNPIIQNALKKVDWEIVTKEVPRLNKEITDEIARMRQCLKERADQLVPNSQVSEQSVWH